MNRRTVRSALLTRVPARQDDRGSIPFLLLVMIITAALGGVLMKTIIDQVSTSRFDQSRVRSLNAAQSGVDWALGQIRTAVQISPTEDLTKGDASRLPCGPWTVSTDGASGTSSYITVAYYTVDPSTLSDDALKTFTPTGNKMICSTNGGPYDSTAKARTPKYAVITSTGTDTRVTGQGASKGRTVQSTYIFQTNDVNISGGQIRIFPKDGVNADYCMDAGSNPAAGTAVTLQQCSKSNPPIAQQVFSYRSDLSIELVSSSKPPAAGLCLDTGGSATTHKVLPLAIVLKTCAVADETPTQPAATFVCPAGYTTATYKTAYPARNCSVSPWNQQWSVNNNAHLEGSFNDSERATQVTTYGANASYLDGSCIDASSQAANVALLLQSCAGGTTDTRQTWVPSPTTGAGMAGAGNNQLVNFQQFATCIDITGQNVNAAFEIAYTCKQDPNPKAVAFNQKFTPNPPLTNAPTHTLLTVTNGGTTYCLKSPLTAGGFPTLSTPCPASPTGAFDWTVYQRYTTAAAGSPELAYSDRYTIKDSSTTSGSSGMCLGLGPNNDLLNGQYYKIVVGQCNGSTAQKWNADPTKLRASLSNTTEKPRVTSSGS